jgi:hypothetical protein
VRVLYGQPPVCTKASQSCWRDSNTHFHTYLLSGPELPLLFAVSFHRLDSRFDLFALIVLQSRTGKGCESRGFPPAFGLSGVCKRNNAQGNGACVGAAAAPVLAVGSSTAARARSGGGGTSVPPPMRLGIGYWILPRRTQYPGSGGHNGYWVCTGTAPHRTAQHCQTAYRKPAKIPRKAAQHSTAQHSSSRPMVCHALRRVPSQPPLAPSPRRSWPSWLSPHRPQPLPCTHTRTRAHAHTRQPDFERQPTPLARQIRATANSLRFAVM